MVTLYYHMGITVEMVKLFFAKSHRNFVGNAAFVLLQVGLSVELPQVHHGVPPQDRPGRRDATHNVGRHAGHQRVLSREVETGDVRLCSHPGKKRLSI